MAEAKSTNLESSRKGVVVDNIRYVSKCPFGTYYCCDLSGKKGSRTTAGEKLRTIQNWKREMISVSVAYPNLKNPVATVLGQILFAEVELSFYNPGDVICQQVAPQGEVQTSDRKMKSRVSSLLQKVNQILTSQRNTYMANQIRS